MRAVVLFVISALAVAAPLNRVRAELPPRSAESKKKAAQDIVTGRVKNVRFHDITGEQGTIIRVFDISIRVRAVEKGDRINSMQSLHFQCCRVIHFPLWVIGPSGQFFIPKVGEVIRVFLGHDPNAFMYSSDTDGYHVLMPNGIDLLKSWGVFEFYEPQPLEKDSHWQGSVLLCVIFSALTALIILSLRRLKKSQ